MVRQRGQPQISRAVGDGFCDGTQKQSAGERIASGGYGHLDSLAWSDDQLGHGHYVKRKELPFLVRLFKLVATDGDIEWVIANDPDETQTTQMVQTKSDVRPKSDVRWQIEQLHRELKQLTGSEKCQCRNARA